MRADDPVVLVPADFQLEERLVGRLTFRTAGWLALAAAGVSLLVAAPGHLQLLLLGLPLTAVGLSAALLRPGGRPVEQRAVSWLGYLHRGGGSRRGGRWLGPAALLVGGTVASLLLLLHHHRPPLVTPAPPPAAAPSCGC